MTLHRLNSFDPKKSGQNEKKFEVSAKEEKAVSKKKRRSEKAAQTENERYFMGYYWWVFDNRGFMPAFWFIYRTHMQDDFWTSFFKNIGTAIGLFFGGLTLLPTIGLGEYAALK
eukprot:CAMPEP_0176370478 /NCGR_PEP_ID=MMETSP0126-20121128/24015_1 /TAXON_ID=141414 ORGANISM="Strombidinopsis acuminatum, Strain SPMC142" /NCGR_SAMPLE_ID=MMETSP0126 /ASSEMBLY_ACC=CAM_ASM_000229 /LENGTH=113 /DNA_ID=CAMNT_0017729529 /DNA_START=123 /DNA_END=464 /DNA_ORIENTATION=-